MLRKYTDNLVHAFSEYQHNRPSGLRLGTLFAVVLGKRLALVAQLQQIFGPQLWVASKVQSLSLDLAIDWQCVIWIALWS